MRAYLRYSNASKIPAACIIYVKVEYHSLSHCGCSFLTAETLAPFFSLFYYSKILPLFYSHAIHLCLFATIVNSNQYNK